MQLIDFSCEDSDQLYRLELFHKMLIKMSYKAAYVAIDYNKKRVYMNVLIEDESYDLESINSFAKTMSVNLSYTNLNIFLKTCIPEDVEILREYYPYLTSCFYKLYKRTSKKSNFDFQFLQVLRANFKKSLIFETA